MRSERWNTYNHINVKNELPEEVYTEKQWNEKGFVKICSDAGKQMQPSKNIKSQYTYLLKDEVREATDQDIKELAEQYRKRKRTEYKRRSEQNKESAEQNMYLFENNISQKETINNLSKSLTLKTQALEYAKEKLTYFSRKNTLWTKKIYNISKAYSEEYLSEHLNDDKKVIVIDMITTGIDHDSEILQLSAIDLTANTLINENYKPLLTTPVNSYCKTENKEITEDYERIQNLILDSSTIIGYNALFITERLEFSGFYIPDHIQIVDLMIDFSEVKPNTKFQNKSVSLSECAAYFGYVQKENINDSLEKCLATLYCYNMLNKKKG